jgi:uncharacterized protein (TIGR02996 family)
MRSPWCRPGPVASDGTYLRSRRSASWWKSADRLNQKAREQQAFIETILAAPADDAPRLVYADWLEEHGDGARAEFIRVQCRVVGMEPPSGSFTGEPGRAEFDRLRRREQELLDAHAHVWLSDLPPGMRPLLPDAVYRTFRRGFVESVTCTAAGWLAHGPAVVAAQPVARVALGDRRPYHAAGTGGRRSFAWYLDTSRDTGVPDDATLPAELFEALAGGRRGGDTAGQPFVLYRPEAEARTALSAACLAWARGRRSH